MLGICRIDTCVSGMRCQHDIRRSQTRYYSCVLNFCVVTHMHRSLMESTSIIELTSPESCVQSIHDGRVSFMVVSKQANVAISHVRTENEDMLDIKRSSMPTYQVKHMTQACHASKHCMESTTRANRSSVRQTSMAVRCTTSIHPHAKT